MKKIFTLVAGVLFAAVVMAADHRPVVTVKSMKNYKIVIDGKAYYGNDLTISLDNFSGYDNGYGRGNGRGYGNGNNSSRHTIQVFEQKRGFFVKMERMVDAATFQASRNDIAISIDRFGQISIREKNSRFDDRDWNDRDHDRRDNRGW